MKYVGPYARVYRETPRTPENRATLNALASVVLRMNVCNGKHTKGRKCIHCKT